MFRKGETMKFYDHELQTWIDSYDIMLTVEDRVDFYVDDLPDSDTREDDLNQLIDFKNSPAFMRLQLSPYGCTHCLDGLKGV